MLSLPYEEASSGEAFMLRKRFVGKMLSGRRRCRSFSFGEAKPLSLQQGRPLEQFEAACLYCQ